MVNVWELSLDVARRQEELTLKGPRRGLRIYHVTHPPDAIGVWISTWSRIIFLFTHSAQGERKDSLRDALADAGKGEEETGFGVRIRATRLLDDPEAAPSDLGSSSGSGSVVIVDPDPEGP